MARTAIDANAKTIASALKAFVAGEPISYFQTRKLVASGHIVTKKETTDAVKAAGRGRHKLTYELSGKGRGLVAISKNWGAK